jgi:hypothetical protein
MLFAAVHESAIGTSSGSQGGEFTSAFGAVTEVNGRTASAAFDANDPSATLAVHCGMMLMLGLSPIKVLV